jgi:hypothetical protein
MTATVPDSPWPPTPPPRLYDNGRCSLAPNPGDTPSRPRVPRCPRCFGEAIEVTPLGVCRCKQGHVWDERRMGERAAPDAPSRAATENCIAATIEDWYSELPDGVKVRFDKMGGQPRVEPDREVTNGPHIRLEAEPEELMELSIVGEVDRRCQQAEAPLQAEVEHTDTEAQCGET